MCNLRCFLSSWKVELLGLGCIVGLLGLATVSARADTTNPNQYCVRRYVAHPQVAGRIPRARVQGTPAAPGCPGRIYHHALPYRAHACIVPNNQVTCTNLCSCTCYWNLFYYTCNSTQSCQASGTNQTCNET